MTNEDSYITSKFRREEPFRVPDGYFDTLTERVMASIDSTQRSTKASLVSVKSTNKNARLWRRVALIAACFCGVVLGLGFLIHPSNQPAQVIATPTTVAELSGENILDVAIDYAMLDNEDMYAYMVE